MQVLEPDVLMQILMLQCCKRGLTNNFVTIYRGERGWKKFEAQFKKEDEEYKEKSDSIYVSYKEAFGEKWKFDHVKYFYDIDIFVFEGDDPYDIAQEHDYNSYQRYHGFHGSAYTFEDAIIQCANKTKKMFGNFDKEENFFTNKEKENHENHEFFLLDSEEESEGGITLATDSDYISVTDPVKNIRWAQWFAKTEEYKQNYPKFKKEVLKTKWDGKVIL